MMQQLKNVSKKIPQKRDLKFYRKGSKSPLSSSLPEGERIKTVN